MDWDAYVHLAFDEIRLAGAGSPQVTRRLSEALTDLETVARPTAYPRCAVNGNCSRTRSAKPWRRNATSTSRSKLTGKASACMPESLATVNADLSGVTSTPSGKKCVRDDRRDPRLTRTDVAERAASGRASGRDGRLRGGHVLRSPRALECEPGTIRPRVDVARFGTPGDEHVVRCRDRARSALPPGRPRAGDRDAG